MNISDRHIQVWGDSILKGIIYDDNSERYEVLDNNCVSRFAQKTGSKITNHAAFGMTSRKGSERIAKSVERRPPSKDDIVLFEFGGNDCDFNWEAISRNPHDNHEPKTPLILFAERMQGIVDSFRLIGLQPVLMSLPPLEPNRFLEWVSRGLDRAEIMVWLGDVNKIYRWQEAYNSVVSGIASKNNLHFIDVRKDFLLSHQYESLFCSDGIHPNAKGHELICDSFLSYTNAV